jgi:hypothetical protein
MRHDIDLRFLFRRDLSAGFINMVAQASLTPQPRLGFGCPNEFKDSLVADQRFTGPIAANEREQPMFNWIPFGGPRRQMRHGDRDVEFIRQLL